MTELGLEKKDNKAIKFAFDVYDLKDDGRVDAFNNKDLIHNNNLNSTLKTIKEIGRVTEKGQKYLKKKEIFQIYKTYKDSKDQGSNTNFIENPKLYDTNTKNQPEGRENEVDITKNINTQFLQCPNCPTLISTLQQLMKIIE